MLPSRVLTSVTCPGAWLAAMVSESVIVSPNNLLTNWISPAVAGLRGTQWLRWIMHVISNGGLPS